MRIEVARAIDEVKAQFPDSTVTVTDDGQGGARLIIEPVSLGAQYRPAATWLGFHIPPQYPYADIYPVFIGAEVNRVDGSAFQVPVTPNHAFESRRASKFRDVVPRHKTVIRQRLRDLEDPRLSGEVAMSQKCRLRMERRQYEQLYSWLYPGDQDEYGAVLLAGVSHVEGVLTLTVREIHRAQVGSDYVPGKHGYRALSPTFIHRMITRARDHRLAYLAVHNHGSDLSADFSTIDMESHERGYPALLQIGRGVPVGALVTGLRAMEADVWLPDGSRLSLEDATIVGETITRLTSAPVAGSAYREERFDRQILMFGAAGQQRLVGCHVGIVGLGGIGSIVAELLSRLGVGRFTLIDPDVIEESNRSRVVGATADDVRAGSRKVDIADALIKQASPDAITLLIADDLAKESVARQLIGVDYLFLAADSMRARLVFNALVHQYQIPGVQLGAKIRATDSGELLSVMSVNRPVRPGQGCLWCSGFIDPTALAQESVSDEERAAQAYGTAQPNPSVIGLNALAAALAVNDFMLSYLEMRSEADCVRYEHFSLLDRRDRLWNPATMVNALNVQSMG